jgi:hypothetical protein
VRSVAWIVSLLVGAAGIWFGLRGPADLAYWVAPVSLLPVGYVGFITFEDHWAGATRRAQVLVWFAAAGLAVAGGAWYLLAPTDGSWVVGGMLCIPVLLITPLLDRGRRDESGDATTAGWGEPFGPP